MSYPIAPDLKNKPSMRLDLNRQLGWIALRDRQDGLPNGLLDPYIFTGALCRLHEKRNIAYSLGGYLEPRNDLWDGSYITEEAKDIHLGLDLNFSMGTRICVSRKCEVVRIDNDHPQPFGWGIRILMKIATVHEPVYLIYAHCLPAHGLAVGDCLEPGAFLGTIAPPEMNGGWYPHVHVQAMIEEAYTYYVTGGRLDELDGYGSPLNLEKWRRWFPDPLQWIDIS